MLYFVYYCFVVGFLAHLYLLFVLLKKLVDRYGK